MQDAVTLINLLGKMILTGPYQLPFMVMLYLYNVSLSFGRIRCHIFFGQNHLVFSQQNLPAGNYMFKVNNRNTRRRCKICSKFSRSGAFIINFKHFSHNIFTVNFEQVNAGIRMLRFWALHSLSLFYIYIYFFEIPPNLRKT